MRTHLLAAAVAACLHGAANAAVTLDQSLTGATNMNTRFSVVGYDAFRRAQTFTVGVEGDLIQVDIELRDAGATTFAGLNVLATVNGAPTDTVVATGSLLYEAGGFAMFGVPPRDIPEPGSVALLLAGLRTLGLARRRRAPG